MGPVWEYQVLLLAHRKHRRSSADPPSIFVFLRRVTFAAVHLSSSLAFSYPLSRASYDTVVDQLKPELPRTRHSIVFGGSNTRTPVHTENREFRGEANTSGLPRTRARTRSVRELGRFDGDNGVARPASELLRSAGHSTAAKEKPG